MHRLLRRRFDCGDTVHDLLYLFEGPGLDLAHALARHNEALLPLAPRPSSEGPDMTETLAEKKCTPCRGGIPPLTHEEAERFRSQTPNWATFVDRRQTGVEGKFGYFFDVCVESGCLLHDKRIGACSFHRFEGVADHRVI